MIGGIYLLGNLLSTSPSSLMQKQHNLSKCPKKGKNGSSSLLQNFEIHVFVLFLRWWEYCAFVGKLWQKNLVCRKVIRFHSTEILDPGCLDTFIFVRFFFYRCALISAHAKRFSAFFLVSLKILAFCLFKKQIMTSFLWSHFLSTCWKWTDTLTDLLTKGKDKCKVK